MTSRLTKSKRGSLFCKDLPAEPQSNAVRSQSELLAFFLLRMGPGQATTNSARRLNGHPIDSETVERPISPRPAKLSHYSHRQSRRDPHASILLRRYRPRHLRGRSTQRRWGQQHCCVLRRPAPRRAGRLRPTHLPVSRLRHGCTHASHPGHRQRRYGPARHARPFQGCSCWIRGHPRSIPPRRARCHARPVARTAGKDRAILRRLSNPTPPAQNRINLDSLDVTTHERMDGSGCPRFGVRTWVLEWNRDSSHSVPISGVHSLHQVRDGIMEPERARERDFLPALPLASWNDTLATLHMWTQIVGKVRLKLCPLVNHFWNVPFYLTARGMTTSPMPYGSKTVEVRFDFIAHQLIIETSDGRKAAIALQPQSVAEFYERFMSALSDLGVTVKIWTTPC